MKITIDELNDAYTKVNKFKINGYPIRTQAEVTIERNPLTDSDYFENSPDHEMFVRLEFELNPNIGLRGAYVLVSEVEVIDNEE
jgi:hypothetical protein